MSTTHNQAITQTDSFEVVTPVVDIKPIKIRAGSKLVDIDANKILDSLTFASVGLDRVDIQKIYRQVVESLYNEISTDEIITLTIKTAANYITEHYQYSYLTARLMLQKLYKEVFGQSVYEDKEFYSKHYVEYFEECLQKGVDIGLVDPRLLEFDLAKLKAAIKPERDLLFKEAGMGRVYNQYLLKTNDDPQVVFELPQFWLMRVAMGLALPESDRESKAIEFYELLSKQLLLSSTPTLLNSGRVRNQCSSCFLLTVDDDLEHIYKTYSDIAKLSKYAGGIGVDFTSVRASGSLIKGTNGKSLGLIPFLKVLDASAAAVNQGGVRKGAVAAYIEPWHRDIFDFISSKYVSVDENRRCPNIHTVVWVPDLFMKRLIDGVDTWTLFSPSDVPDLHHIYGEKFETQYQKYEQDPTIPKQVVSLRKLWEEILVSLLGKGFGHPWITFKDPSNARNPQDHVGVVHSSNLCTEILLPTNKDETAVCNLASINLSKFVLDTESFDPMQKIDWNQLKSTIQTAMRMLDNVIDVNFYTTIEAENSNKRHRPVGLGVMGWQEMLQILGIPMESEVAVNLSDTLFEFISFHSIQTSVELSKEKGSYSTFAGSKWSQGILPIDSLKNYSKERKLPVNVNMDSTLEWDTLRSDIQRYGLRNSQQLAIAPTRSISYIAATSPSIEPWDSNIFTEVGMTGKYQMINERLVDALEEEGLWTPEVIQQIKMADGSVQWIDSVPQRIKDTFKTAWEIHPKWLISQNARRQKWVDMGISFNMWLPVNNGKDAERLYMECWKAGLKTTYYLHTKSGDVSKLNSNQTPVAATVTETKILPDGTVCDMTDPDCEACQ